MLRSRARASRSGGRAERRQWWTNGLAALTVSALGLALAGTGALTTSAQQTDPAALAAPRPRAAAVPAPRLTPQTSPTPPPAAARAFARRDEAAEAPSRSSQLRAALVKERAAQRSEDLSKTAEEVTRAGRSQSSAARRAQLRASDRAIQAVAVRLAELRRQKAEAARKAAEQARAEAEAASAERARSTPNTVQEPAEPQESPEPKKSQDSEPSDPTPDSGGGSASPVPGAVIGAHFGQYGSWSRYHTGLDFRAGHGTPIKAVKSGVVLYAGNSGDWAGNHVAIKHADGKTTMSSHMSSMAVGSGETVSAGQVIGYVGSTGRSFGAHLHFELYPSGVKYGDVYKAINPQPWLSDNGVNTN